MVCRGAAADYYRTSYLYFVKGRSFVDLDSSAALRSDYEELSWRDQPWHKLLLALYLNFTRQQEMLAPRLKRLTGDIDSIVSAPRFRNGSMRGTKGLPDQCLSCGDY